MTGYAPPDYTSRNHAGGGRDPLSSSVQPLSSGCVLAWERLPDDPPLAFDLLMLKQKPCNEGRRVDDAADDLCAHRGG